MTASKRIHSHMQNSQLRQSKPFEGDRCPKHSQSEEPKSTMAANKWISKQSQPHARTDKCRLSTRPSIKEWPIRVHQAMNPHARAYRCHFAIQAENEEEPIHEPTSSHPCRACPSMQRQRKPSLQRQRQPSLC